MTNVLAIDPGETNGVAYTYAVNSDVGYTIKQEQMRRNRLFEFLISSPGRFDIVVLEDFIILPGKSDAFKGNKMEVIQIIGAVRFFCHEEHVPLVLQLPADKEMGCVYSGVKPPSDHSISHMWDAYNHLWYYMVRSGEWRPIEKPASDDELFTKPRSMQGRKQWKR